MFLYFGYKLVFLAVVAMVVTLGFSRLGGWGCLLLFSFFGLRFWKVFSPRQHCQLSSLLLLNKSIRCH